jgi:hypothetical protein
VETENRIQALLNNFGISPVGGYIPLDLPTTYMDIQRFSTLSYMRFQDGRLTYRNNCRSFRTPPSGDEKVCTKGSKSPVVVKASTNCTLTSVFEFGCLLIALCGEWNVFANCTESFST